MSRTLGRRALFGAGAGAVASVPLLVRRAVAASPLSGELVTLSPPIRVYDSRQPGAPLGGAKLTSGGTIAVTVSQAYADSPSGYALAVFANVTITQTERSGYLVVRGEDLSGEQPLPATSNINWSTADLTLANLVLSPVGGENAIEIHCAGGGSTHVIVDIQGYVPFTA